MYILFSFFLLAKSPISTEEKAPDSVCDNGIKKNATIIGNSSTNTPSKAKKRKKAPRDATAPKQPLSGYFRYNNLGNIYVHVKIFIEVYNARYNLQVLKRSEGKGPER